MKMTHTGIIEGSDARTPKDWSSRIALRETKNYWITTHGVKFSKKRDGTGTGDWPMYTLRIDSIQPNDQVQPAKRGNTV